MLTFTSAVGKLNLCVLWHHHTLLHVISQSYCQVFVKSYNFIFEKINIEYAPRKKWQKAGDFCIYAVYALSFRLWCARMLPNSQMKTALLHIIIIT